MFAGLATTTMGASITYTDWISAGTPGVYATAFGTLNLPGGPVNVAYNGEFSVAQLNNTGTQYWTEPNPSALPYTGNLVVGNAPSTSDIIELSEPSGQEANKITFSQPVANPIMLINSLGSSGRNITVSYAFNDPFTLLSAGQGYFGGTATTLTASGQTLSGTEGAGAIEFIGNVTSISWTTTGSENWNGFTIGAAPDGGTTLGLLGMSFSCLLGIKARKFITRSPASNP
jgi:hypothetical protein